jgi:hypothetical protein
MPKIISDAEEKSFPVIEPGKYLVEVQSVRELDKEGKPKTDKNGNVLWNVEMVIITEGLFFEKRVWDNIIFSEKLASRTKSIFNAFGFDTTHGMEIDKSDILVGRMAVVEIEKSEYKGQPQSKVRFFDGYLKIGDSNKKESEEDQIPF